MTVHYSAQAVRESLARGDLLGAYDLVSRAKEARGEDHDSRYLEVLTLARLGDTEQAWRLYQDYAIGRLGGVDALSLQARLLKDQAFGQPGYPDQEKLLEACHWYSVVYRMTGSSYPAINAATLARIAGRPRLATNLARAVIRAASSEKRQDYFSFATVAEALVVLNDIDGARAALSRAMCAEDADIGARSTTLLQLQRLSATVSDPGALDGLLDLIRPPKVAMFCGDIFLPNQPVEAMLAAQVSTIIARENVGYGYGALVAGSNILIAEQILASGAKLHVVLPFAEADFIERSVAPGGAEWLRRYGDCKAGATSFTFTSKMSCVGDESQLAYGSKVSMGLARLRARHLQNEAIQLAIIQSSQAATLSGFDIATWRAGGGKSFVVTADDLQRPAMPPPPTGSFVERRDVGIMFTDYPGFSELDERVLPNFWEDIMMRAARTLQGMSHRILQSNTWGDALFVVFQDASTAAAAALDLRDQFAEVDCRALGVPEGTAMRIGLHYGSTYVAKDERSDKPIYYGSEVSLAARIEPVTPPGSVYVTEPFAAVLEMEADPRFTCSYVGRLSLAKSYGVFPIYRLARRATSGNPPGARARLAPSVAPN